jgi:hypothetical protein
MTARLEVEQMCMHPLPDGPCGHGLGHADRHRSTVYLARKAERYVTVYSKGKEKAHVDRLRARVAQVKLERGCADCGYRAHAEALDLDHVDSAHKVDDVSRLVSKRVAWSSLIAEIAKCDVVCANCHRVRTRKRLEALRVF